MKVGKLQENVLRRAVLKQIHTRRPEVVLGAAVGEDCAALKLEQDEIVVMSANPITGTVLDMGMFALWNAANDLASAGAEPVGVMLTILLPEKTKESELRFLMQQIEEACVKAKMQVLGGHTEVTRAVNQPVITVCGVGKAKAGKLIETSGVEAGMDIILTKWIGMEGTAILAKNKEDELKTRFSESFIEKARKLDSNLSVCSEAAVAVSSGVSAMHNVSEGGIFGALWEMAEASGVGLEIDLKKIPVRQETIEVCEFFGINPYELISGGAMLMAAADGNKLVRELEKVGIPADIIGKATEGKDRVILNEDEKRFLERPKADELYKVMDSLS